MKITSPQFENGGNIPSRCTCDGENMSPTLIFEDVPDEAQSLALIMEDPDVPKNLRPDGMFDHWVVWNIPPDTKEIAEGMTAPGITGKNTNGDTAYAGPCPPDREHRYFFTLYALSAMLDLPASSSKDDLERAMIGHILAEVQFMGRYTRK